MAKRKKQTGLIATAENFVRNAIGYYDGLELQCVSCTYDAIAAQWAFMVIVGDDAIAVTYYPPIVRDGIPGGDVWAM